MQEMSRKNKLFTDSVIRRMTRVSLACGAINLAQGFPDFDPPKALTDRLAEVSALGPHQYPITMGAPNFRQALARKAGRFMGRTLDPETDMVVTIGSTEAMVDTIFALTNPGDKIIMFSPYFENYRAQAIMADCEPVFVPLVPPEFNFDANVLEDAFKQGAKAILICNPSNPSGKVFTYDELKLISELCIKYDAFAIMDEVYEHIVYDGHKHIYMNSLPGMWERTAAHHGPHQAVPRLQYRRRAVSADGSRRCGPRYAGQLLSGVRRALCAHEKAVHRRLKADRHSVYRPAGRVFRTG